MDFKKTFRLILLLSLIFLWSCQKQDKFIKIGIVHSLTGTMAISEKPMVDALLLAVDDVNNNGGVLGKKIKPIVIDGMSDPAIFIAEVERLITEEEVSAVFACWTSRCRKAIKPIVEKHDSLLFYSVQFEGLETSDNIIYFGSAPNQHLIPGLDWMLQNIGSPLYLVGSDTIFPRSANKIIRNMVYMKEERLVGERYVPLGGIDMRRVISDIKDKKPVGIINTINGDSNKAFFKALADNGLDDIPVMSFSIGEREVEKIGKQYLKNHYVTVNYMESIPSQENLTFIRSFQDKYGENKAVGGAMISAYSAVKLWAKTVNESKTMDSSHVRKAMSNKSIHGPSGVISVEPKSGYIWQTVHVGKIQANGSILAIWNSKKPIRPKPFPMAHSQETWLRMLKKIETRF